MLEFAEAARVLTSAIPFMVLSNGRPQEINKTRLWESVIQSVLVAAVVGMGGYFIAFPALKGQVEAMAKESEATRELIKEIKRDIDIRAARRDAMDAAQDARIVQIQIEMARNSMRK